MKIFYHLKRSIETEIKAWHCWELISRKYIDISKNQLRSLVIGKEFFWSLPKHFEIPIHMNLLKFSAKKKKNLHPFFQHITHIEIRDIFKRLLTFLNFTDLD